MSYKLTDAQRRAIVEFDMQCQREGMPSYWNLIEGAARVCIGMRDNKPRDIQRGAATLAHEVNKLRNDTATSDANSININDPALSAHPTAKANALSWPSVRLARKSHKGASR